MGAKIRQPNPVTCVATVKGYQVDYSFGVSSDQTCLGYNTNATLEVTGVIAVTDSLRTKPGTRVEITLMRDSREPPTNFRPQCIGVMQKMKDKLTAYIQIPDADISWLLPLLLANKIEALDLLAYEFFRNKSKILSFRAVSKFEWEDWA